MNNKIVITDKKFKCFADRFYCYIITFVNYTLELLKVCLRLFVRFLAINYYFCYGIDWGTCNRNKLKVYFDLQYIFWCLHYYPENYFSCRLWEKDRKDWKYYYGSIYDPVQRYYLRKSVHKKENIDIFENKFTCYCYCKIFGLPVPETYFVFNPSTIGFTKVKEIIHKFPDKSFILKFNSGKGGSGILRPYLKEGSFFIQHGKKDYQMENVQINGDLILQEKIVQHEIVNKMSTSLNTLRVITLLNSKGIVCIAGAYMRFGVDNSLVDNMSSGGVGVNVDIKKGVLKGYAYDRHIKPYKFHMTSGLYFDGFEIPFFNEILSLVKTSQKYFYFHRLLGFDIAITPKGPTIVEINAEPDMIDFEALTGPLFYNSDVYDFFRDSGLLINNLSKTIIVSRPQEPTQN